MRCIHCGVELRGKTNSGLLIHVTGLWRCQSNAVPYGHMGHPAMPCPPGEINPCQGYREALNDQPCAHIIEGAHR